jgi:chromosome segregation ATPase
MNMSATMISVLDRAVELATREDEAPSDWRSMLEQLDMRIRRNTETLGARPSVPKELRDDYRREIDAVSMENMILGKELEQTKSSLERVKSAYKEERRHTAALEEKLDELEEQLVGLLKRRSVN